MHCRKGGKFEALVFPEFFNWSGIWGSVLDESFREDFLATKIIKLTDFFWISGLSVDLTNLTECIGTKKYLLWRFRGVAWERWCSGGRDGASGPSARGWSWQAHISKPIYTPTPNKESAYVMPSYHETKYRSQKNNEIKGHKLLRPFVCWTKSLVSE